MRKKRAYREFRDNRASRKRFHNRMVSEKRFHDNRACKKKFRDNRASSFGGGGHNFITMSAQLKKKKHLIVSIVKNKDIFVIC